MNEEFLQQADTIIRRYLAAGRTGPQTVENVCIEVHPLTCRAIPSGASYTKPTRMSGKRRPPADAIASRFVFEEPDDCWTARIVVITRGGQIWCRYVDEIECHEGIRTDDEVRALFLAWLQSV
ncbi:hypothetical protein [Methylobacterium nodulans]|uniref:Uncharacterized protein n=1 Tax=Methylobacterium nodulans (strain LMG 21967 / CNCM I-2342 / ORS 2060) TaxID=460265 RepID=B8IXZ1_METNO|nr:hypothetical protein [Methylobacterium nodulans]ACL63281.1 hypothetical protein Mnod_7687 [Methylobacterium nodulans ORS 2060]